MYSVDMTRDGFAVRGTPLLLSISNDDDESADANVYEVRCETTLFACTFDTTLADGASMLAASSSDDRGDGDTTQLTSATSTAAGERIPRTHYTDTRAH